jgi:hypothetical protein
MFKTRNAMCKVHVETDENSLFDGSEVKHKVERTREDIQDFLVKFNALAETSDGSKSHQLFIVGDSFKFYDTHKHLRQEKINGSKIVLILVGENKHHPELPKISTSHMHLSNMVGDVLQVMVDLGIVSERKTLKKTLTVNRVKDPTKAEVNQTAVKVTWRLKGRHDVLADPGYVSVQIKNSNSGRWEELELKEASGMTDEIDFPNRKIDEEFQVMFEDAKTGSLSTPVYIKYPEGHQSKSVINRILCFLCILIMFKSLLEGIIMVVACFPYSWAVVFICTDCPKRKTLYLFYVTFLCALIFDGLLHLILLAGFDIKVVVGSIVANVLLSLLSYLYLYIMKDIHNFLKEHSRIYFRDVKNCCV